MLIIGYGTAYTNGYPNEYWIVKNRYWLMGSAKILTVHISVVLKA